MIAPAVQNALGVWVEDFPLTPDRVIKALEGSKFQVAGST
jgi:CO/xanthine dehydrogenase Mo-binding subunit